MRVILGLLGIALQRQRQDLANEREEGDGIFRGLLFEVLLTALGLERSEDHFLEISGQLVR